MVVMVAPNGCEHEQCGFGANQLSLTTNLVGTTHFHNQKTSIAYACCYAAPCIIRFHSVIQDMSFQAINIVYNVIGLYICKKQNDYGFDKK